MGKARSFSDSSKDIVYQKETNNENYAMSSQQNAYNLGSTHFSDQSGIGNFSQSGNDQRKLNVKGGLIQGNIGHIQQTAVLNVSTEIIDLNTDSSGVALSVISEDRIVTLSSGSTGTLTTITGVQRQGQRLTLYNISTNTITITHTASATANTILTPDGNNFTFSNSMVIEFVYDITTAQWRLVTGVSGGSGSGSTLPVVDTTSIVKGSVDDTKLMRFEVDGLTTGVTRVMTIPDSDTTLAGLIVPSQTWTGTNTWTGTTFDVSTITSAVISSPLFTVNSALFTIGDSTSDILTMVGRFGSSLIPTTDNTYQLGSSSLEWSTVFTQGINATTQTTIASPILEITSALTIFGDATSDIINFVGRIGSSILPTTDNTYQLGSSSLEWSTVFTQGINATTQTTIASPILEITSALITLGDATSDIINYIGRVGSSILPTTDNTYQLGSSALEWSTIYTQGINATTQTTIASPILEITSALTIFGDATSDIINFVGRIGSSILPTTDNTYQLGSSSLEWSTVFTQGINATTQTTIASPILEITSALITFGDSATDIVNFVGVIGSSLIPNLDLSFDLGTSLKEWSSLFVATIDAFTSTTIASPILTISSSLVNFSGAINTAPTYTDGVKQTFNPNATNAGINVGSQAGNPSTLVNGDIWYNSSTGVLNGRIGGVTTDLGGSGGTSNSISQNDSSLTVVDGSGFTSILDSVTLTTLTSSQMLYGVNLNMNTTNSILNPLDITLSNGFSITNTGATVTTMDIPSGEDLIFSEATTEIGRYDGGLNSWTFNPSGDITLNPGDDCLINVTDDFFLQDNGSTVFSYNGGTNLFTFENDILLDNGTRIRSNDSTEIGFFVKNDTSTLGTDGSMQIPSSTSTSIGNNSDLDTHFGSGIGCIGVYGINSSVPVLAIKIQSGTWALVTLPDSSTNIVGDHVT